MRNIVDRNLMNSDSTIGGNSEVADICGCIFIKPDNIVYGVVGQAVGLAIRCWYSCFCETGDSYVIKANFVCIAFGKPEVAMLVEYKTNRRRTGGSCWELLPEITTDSE